MLHRGTDFRKELLSALRSRLPELASQDTISVGERSLNQEEVLLIHFVYGIDPLDPKLWQWQLTEEDATHRIRPDVPQSIKDRLRSQGAGAILKRATSIRCGLRPS